LPGACPVDAVPRHVAPNGMRGCRMRWPSPIAPWIADVPVRALQACSRTIRRQWLASAEGNANPGPRGRNPLSNNGFTDSIEVTY
jgi:hypothetical protein